MRKLKFMRLKSPAYLCRIARRAGKSSLYFGGPCLFFSLSPLTLLLAHSYLRSVGSRGMRHLGIIKTKETKASKEKRHLIRHPGTSLLEPRAALRSGEALLVRPTALPVAPHSTSGCTALPAAEHQSQGRPPWKAVFYVLLWVA